MQRPRGARHPPECLPDVVVAALVWAPPAPGPQQARAMGGLRPEHFASAVLLFSVGVSTGQPMCGFRRQFSKRLGHLCCWPDSVNRQQPAPDPSWREGHHCRF